MTTTMFDLAKRSCREIKKQEILFGVNSTTVLMFNNWVEYILKNFSEGNIVKLLQIAFIEYNLQVNPKDMPLFNDIHKKYGKKILGV